MRRFSASFHFIERHREEHGNCILFTDHEAAIGVLTRIIEEQRKANDELNAGCMRLGSLEVDDEADIKQAVADEREACMEIASTCDGANGRSRDAIIAAIRQRG